MLAFTLSIDQAELFYGICKELNADTEEKRVAILEAMAQLGQVKNVVKSSMTKEEYITHLAKHFKVDQIGK